MTWLDAVRDFLDAFALTVFSVLAVIGGIVLLFALVAHARLRDFRNQGGRH